MAHRVRFRIEKLEYVLGDAAAADALRAAYGSDATSVDRALSRRDHAFVDAERHRHYLELNA